MGCSPWGREESDTTERLHFYFSLSCIGEGNGNPLQCSCLENPRDRRAWWTAFYGVAHSRTRLKQLSSSSSNINWFNHFRIVFGHLYEAKHIPPYDPAILLTDTYTDKHTYTYMQKAWVYMSIRWRVGAFLAAQCKESACQCRGHWFDPWSGKTTRAMEQLSPCFTTTKPPL